MASVFHLATTTIIIIKIIIIKHDKNLNTKNTLKHYCRSMASVFHHLLAALCVADLVFLFSLVVVSPVISSSIALGSSISLSISHQHLCCRSRLSLLSCCCLAGNIIIHIIHIINTIDIIINFIINGFKIR